jgi:hypothetical protein
MFPCQIKGKYSIYFFWLVSIVFIAFPRSSQSNEAVPLEVLEAAVNGLQNFLYAIPIKDIKYYGFSSRNEFSSARLGKPIRVSTITPDRINAYEQGTDFTSIISPTNLWLFPVLSQGKAKTLLKVDRMNGTWKAVAIGSTGLAMQLDEVKTSWPSSDGYKHTFVRIYQANSDLMVLSKRGAIKIKPLSSHLTPSSSAKVSMQSNKAIVDSQIDLYDPSEVMAKIRPIVKRNIQFDQTN